MNLYHPAVLSDWQGRTDANEHEYFYQIIQPLDLTQNIPKKAAGFALLSFECDLGIQRNQGRTGAKAGSKAIKQAVARLPMHQRLTLYDAGSIIPQGHDLVAAQVALGKALAKLLAAGLKPIVLGGGHETAWGHYQGIAQQFTSSLNIINFDAHFDLRDLPADQIGTSGTSFRQIAQARPHDFNYYCIGIQQTGNSRYLFETAHKLQTQYLAAENIYNEGAVAVERFVEPIIKTGTPIYLSLCLDVFAACFAPGVSAPQPLGLNPWQIIPALKKLMASGLVVSVDIVELAPEFDLDQRTAKLAAQLLAIILNTWQTSDVL